MRVCLCSYGEICTEAFSNELPEPSSPLHRAVRRRGEDVVTHDDTRCRLLHGAGHQLQHEAHADGDGGPRLEASVKTGQRRGRGGSLAIALALAFSLARSSSSSTQRGGPPKRNPDNVLGNLYQTWTRDVVAHMRAQAVISFLKWGHRGENPSVDSTKVPSFAMSRMVGTRPPRPMGR